MYINATYMYINATYMYINATYMNINATYMYIYHAPRCVVLNACSSLLCVSHNTLCYNKHVSDIALARSSYGTVDVEMNHRCR